MGCGCSQSRTNRVIDSHIKNLKISGKIKETYCDEGVELLISEFLWEVYKKAKTNLRL